MYKEYMKSVICKAIDESDAEEIYVREMCDEKLVTIIQQIQNILLSYDDNDFECVEDIISILEKNGFNCGGCHDF